MSLNYDFRECKPAIEAMIEKLVEEGYDRDTAETSVYSIVDAMIWETISIDLPGYDENNHEEVMKRIRFDEALFGNWAYIRVDGEDKCVPCLEEWVTLVHGLKVNVTKKSWIQYRNKKLKRWNREHKEKRERILNTP